jgi:hypothetical protein
MDHTGIDWDLLTHDAKDWFTSLVSGSVMILLLMDRLIGPVLEIWIPADSRFWKLYSRVEKTIEVLAMSRRAWGRRRKDNGEGTAEKPDS